MYLEVKRKNMLLNLCQYFKVLNYEYTNLKIIGVQLIWLQKVCICIPQKAKMVLQKQ
jgi:hypothetical protein